MKFTRKTGIALLIFLASYTILLLPQINLNRVYAEYFCKLGNRLYKDFPRGGFVRLSTQSDKGKNDISLFISKSEWIENGQLMGVSTNKASDRIGYLISAFFVALTLATPVSWKRKSVALLLGLAIITAFVMLKLYIIILEAYTHVEWFGLFQEPAEKERIRFWYGNFAAPATYGYSFVLIVWLAMSIGKKEWRHITGFMRDFMPVQPSKKMKK